MLSNNKRVAVKRIPSHELMYSAVGKCCGKNCGKIQTILLTVSYYHLILRLYFHITEACCNGNRYIIITSLGNFLQLLNYHNSVQVL